MRIVLLTLIAFMSGCSSFFYYPDSNIYYRPEQFSIPFETIEMKSSDGITIHGMLLKSKKEKSKGLVVQFHGNAQNMSSHMISLMWLTELGYDLFTFDYRGYGNSEGSPDPEGVNRDALVALEKAKELQTIRKAPKLIAYGQSLGGTVLMRALEDHGIEGIDHLILESTFMSYRTVAASIFKKNFLTYLFSPLAYVIVDGSYSPKNVPSIPLLVIHGTHDPVINYQFGKEIFDSASDPKQMWRVEKGGHINTYFLEQGKYREKLIQYLK